MMNEDP